MKKASIISIGNELLIGQMADTNAVHISEKLLSLNMPVVSIHTAPDEIDAIVRAIQLAAEEADIILTTGGLGPTDDDLTRRAFAKFLNAELVLQNDLLQKIGGFFIKRNVPMPENNKIQAYIPAGTKALVNNLGTAPGIMADFKGKLFFAMPGVPAEMKKMLEESVLPLLGKSAEGQFIEIRKLKCFGEGESAIAERLGNLMQRGRNPLVNCTVEYGDITLYIVAAAKDKQAALNLTHQDEKLLRNILANLVYGTGEQTLAEVVGERLALHQKTLAIAESCTGGMLAELVTDVSGASRYFTHGWVTYSDEAKISDLGIPADLIEKYGAVSNEVAEAMAKCAREKAKTDFAVGITGIAGPTGATGQKPVGLVFISVSSQTECETRQFIFPHGRKFIRLRAALTALNILRLRLLKVD
jgi:nicotinamide-nucleotide amidase